MIAKAAPARRSGRGSFCDLREYLERDGRGYEREDLLGTWSGNVAAHATADLEMERVAARGKATDPIFHVILSWRPGEDVSAETVRGAINATLESVGAERRQWFAAAHLDPETQRTHLHLVINKIDPRTHKALDRSWFHAKLARAAEWIEREYGCLADRRMDWRAFEITERNYGSEVTPDRAREPDYEPPRNLSLVPDGAKTAEMDAALRAGYSWVRLVREEAIPAAHAVLAAEEPSWEKLHATLETYGLRMQAKGSGARLVGAEPGLHLKASRAGLDVRTLEQTLGKFREPERTESPHEERLLHARWFTAAADSWPELHANLAEVGLAIDAGRGGPGGDLRGRVVDLEVDGRKTAARAALGESLSSLEKRLGAYEVAPEIVVRAARETERRSDTIAARVALLLAEPQIVVERVAATRSTWERADVAREVRTILDVDDGKAWTAEVECVVDAALAPVPAAPVPPAQVTDPLTTAELLPVMVPVVVSLGIVRDEDGTEREIFSTTAIVAAERSLHAAAKTLAERESGGENALRPPSEELDQQQVGAYAEIASPRGLAIVQGIAGAGKSRMLRDVAAAYAEAGFRVLGAAVAADAARVLGEEAQIDTRTVMSLLFRLGSGRERLDERTVLLIDEASTLGTSDARALLEAAGDGGARVRLLGDAEQHGSVARGNVLADLSEAHGSFAMPTSRRAQELWLREVAVDLRRGATTRALGVLREHGCIAEHRTTEDAKAALIDAWARDVRADRDVLLVATKRADVLDLNVRARAAIADRLGEARPYTTAFGEREVAVGELLVARMPERKSKTVNGDRLRVVGHRENGRIVCERERDGAKIAWDVRENAEIDYGYASTSYRSQGRTVDAVYVLASQADDRRGLYVDATRARQTVLIAYGRDEVPNFGAFLALGTRERLAQSVHGVEKLLAARDRARDVAPPMPEPERDREPIVASREPEPAPVMPQATEEAPRPPSPVESSEAQPPVRQSPPYEVRRSSWLPSARVMEEQAAAQSLERRVAPSEPERAAPIATAEEAARRARPASPATVSVQQSTSTLPATAPITPRSVVADPVRPSMLGPEPAARNSAKDVPAGPKPAAPAARAPQPNVAPVPAPEPTTFSVARLRSRLDDWKTELEAAQAAAEREIARANHDPYGRHRNEPLPRTAEGIVARRLEVTGCIVERTEAAAWKQRREKNQGFLTLTRSPEQRERDASTAEAYERARDEHERHERTLRDPKSFAQLTKTLRAGDEAGRTLAASRDDYRDARESLDLLAQTNIRSIAVPAHLAAHDVQPDSPQVFAETAKAAREACRAYADEIDAALAQELARLREASCEYEARREREAGVKPEEPARRERPATPVVQTVRPASPQPIAPPSRPKPNVPEKAREIEVDFGPDL